MKPLTTEDIEYIRQRGSDPEEVLRRFAYFEKGFDHAQLAAPALIDDGIVKLSEEQIEELVTDYPERLKGKKVVKFVPASGAASRMFKELYNILDSTDESVRVNAQSFLRKLPSFPFYQALEKVMKRDGYSLCHEIEYQNYLLIIRYILEPVGLNYGKLPKGLLLFHRYKETIRTAAEEHLVEAALYAKNNDNTCNIHFTVSPQSRSLFESILNNVIGDYEKKYAVKYDISYSIQEPSSDTLAADMENNPFRDEQGALLFRPGGHGALIHNLNRLHSDLVFIKNIDNVITEDKIAPTVEYKKALAAYLLELQSQLFSYLTLLEQKKVDEMLLCEILDFAESELMIHLDEEDLSQENLFRLLNRPIRVCGMVKNEGEPGGGPYWTISHQGVVSLQIVESSQMNSSDESQKEIISKAAFFNPVDMVCSFIDYKGNYFNLTDFIDATTGFISQKTYGERSLKAMELPGLWNGAMADWITIFVEVPLTTFNPVKTVFDLLKR